MMKIGQFGLMSFVFFSSIHAIGNATTDNVIGKKADGLSNVVKEPTKCPPQPFSGGTISAPGYYCLTNDLSSDATEPLITIASSNVVLDLDGHTLSVTANVPAVIWFDQAYSYSGVVIKNGFLVGPDTSHGNPGIHSISSLKNITFENLNLRRFAIGINLNTQIWPAITEGVVIKNCTFIDNYSLGLSLTNARSFSIQGCSMLSNEYGLVMTGCSDVIIEKSFLNSNKWAGMGCVATSNILIDNCQYNDNSGGYDYTTLEVNAGMTATSCKNIQINNSQFCGNIQNTWRQSSGLMLNQTQNVRITNCNFNENKFFGVLCSGAQRLTITDSQAHRNYDYGFDLKNSDMSSLVGCKAYGNSITGFRVSGKTELINCAAYDNGEGEGEGEGSSFVQAGFVLDNADAVVRNCLALHNNAAGFDVSGGTTGLIQNCVAIKNGSCGFNSADTSATHMYVGNIAKNNGNSPASSGGDTNYCVANVATALLSAPFNQTLQSAASDLNNITA